MMMDLLRDQTASWMSWTMGIHTPVLRFITVPNTTTKKIKSWN
jgi:hypothetical protein